MYLEKDDVSLYYESRGSGDALLLIHGVIVDAGLFSAAAEILSRHYQVITFDRRGNSRSTLRAEKAFSMEDQVRDIRDLLDHLGIERAFVVGASAGAVVGEYFMECFPERVRHLVMYEPAMLGYMVREPEVKAWTEKMQALIEKKKYNSAILQFALHIASFDERSPKKSQEDSMREMNNHIYALTVEFPGMLYYEPDLEKMKKNAARITLAAGERSKDTVYRRCSGLLAGEIGKECVFFPGYHNLPYDLPVEFAVCVAGVIELLRED